MFRTASVLMSMLGLVPSAAQDMLFECRGDFEIYIAASGQVTGTGTLTNCHAVGNPGITSGTVAITGYATVQTFVELVTDTTDVITWNTGETTTVTSVRTFTGIAAIVEVGTGASVAGLFHPSTEAETGTGTRQSHGIAASSGIQTKTINLITGFFDD